MGFILNLDKKIHLNLSEQAYSVINNDMFDFFDMKIKLTTIIGNIIMNYYESANATIQNRLVDLRMQYDSLFEEMNKLKKNSLNDKSQAVIINIANKRLINKLKSINLNYPKGVPLKVSLRTNVVDLIENIVEEEEYYDSPSDYIKAILEEYSRLPFVKREEILCKDKIDLIKKAINKKYTLKITTKSKQEFKVIPYEITTDKLSMFNYLVGIDFETRNPVCYRILNCSFTQSSAYGSIKTDERNLIDSRLITNDITFLTNKKEPIKVKLSPVGINQYHSQIHLRPQYTHIDGDIYEFNCSRDQIKFYFRKFGSSIKIVEPVDLAKSFENFYKYALQEYQEDPQE